MELDIIVLKDELYHVVKYAKNVVDCFDMCDVVRENITTYIDSINRHIRRRVGWWSVFWLYVQVNLPRIEREIKWGRSMMRTKIITDYHFISIMSIDLQLECNKILYV